MSDIEGLVGRLFGCRWLCNADKPSLSILHTDPSSIVIIDEFVQVNSGVYREDSVTRTVDEPNEEGIRSMMANIPRVTNTNSDSDILRMEDAYLTTADIADIIHGDGTVEVVDPKDVVSIHTDIRMYLAAVELEQQVSPHYKPPPSEDLSSLSTLRDMIETLANQFQNAGRGDSAMARLLGLNTVTASGHVESVKLNRSKIQRMGMETNRPGDPYAIR